MPIEARTFPDAVRFFKEHLSGLLAQTITQAPVTQIRAGGSHFTLQFRQAGAPTAVPISTCFGPMEFWIYQLCNGEQVGSTSYRLHTAKYRYALTSSGDQEPVVRWEYVRDQRSDERWSRHHLQGVLDWPPREGMTLNDLHLPTGYVTIEEVIRFCIHDLQVPPLSHDWDEVLSDSYQRFKTEFAV